MRVALIDADIVAFKAAVLFAGEEFDWGDTGTGWSDDDMEGALRWCAREVRKYLDATGSDEAKLCLSDPKGENFRKRLNPSYKANRTTKPPALLKPIQQTMRESSRSSFIAGLEGDDVMGILQTSDVVWQTVIVSEDKDMRTVPGPLYNPRRPDMGVIDISEDDATRFHLWQTIVGDPTDGYPGCPGLGPKSEYAQGVLEFDPEPDFDLWDIVLDGYRSKGYTEEDALMQARMAFILQDYAFDNKTGKVELWSPHWLN